MTELLAAERGLPENHQMADKLKTTVRIQRPAKIRSDGDDRSVWAGTVETAELELLSTVALKKILKSTDEAAKDSIAAAADSGDEGVLARDLATGHFEIVNDTVLQAIIERDLNPPKQEKVADVIYEPAFDGEGTIEELSLVSTLALKKILKEEDDEDTPVAEEIDQSGFDPYDSG